MTTTLRVLSIGSSESRDAVRDALLLRHKCLLSAVASYRDLCDIPASESLEIAIVHQTLPEHELLVSLEYVRRHWPSARILLISAHSEAVDDPLYDEWARPEISQDAFLSIIERLAIDAKRNKRQPFERRMCSGERRKCGPHD
jgi:DNA-binding NtrC family response regulator